MDYIDLSLCPPGAPSALKDIAPAPSLPSVRFSERAGRDEEDKGKLPSVRFSEAEARRLGFRKEIVYDREADDFLMLLDTGSGPEPVGYARSWADADLTLDELIFAIRFETDTPGTFCPSCGDELHEDAAVCAACREGGE